MSRHDQEVNGISAANTPNTPSSPTLAPRYIRNDALIIFPHKLAFSVRGREDSLGPPLTIFSHEFRTY